MLYEVITNTIYELLYSIKDKGVAEIEPYLNIQHNPTIGDMYEGLTKILTDKAIFKGLDLRVTSGKIKNIYGVLSRQIDCMIVVGNGEKIPFTEDYIYEVVITSYSIHYTKLYDYAMSETICL